MKKFLPVLIAISLLFSACKKDLEPVQTIPDGVSTLNDVTVPAGFDWKMYNHIEIPVSNLPQEGVINITSVDKTIRYFKGVADGNPVKLTLPKLVDVLLINGSEYAVSGQQIMVGKDLGESASAEPGNFFKSDEATFNPYQSWSGLGDNKAYEMSAVAINDYDFLLFYSDMTLQGWAVIGSCLDGTTVEFGTPVPISSVNDVIYPTATLLSETAVMLSFIENTGSSRGVVVLAQISGQNISVVDQEFVLVNPAIYNLRVDALSSQKIILGYLSQSPSGVMVKTADISGQSIVMGTEYMILSQSISPYLPVHVVALSDNKFVVGYNNYPWMTYLGKVCEFNGPALSQGPQIVIETSNYSGNDLKKVATDKVMYVADHRTMVVEANGLSLIKGPNIHFKGASYSYHTSICKLDEDMVHLVTSNQGNGYHVESNMMTINNLTTTWEMPVDHEVVMNHSIYQLRHPIANIALGDNTMVILGSSTTSGYTGFYIVGQYGPTIIDSDLDGVPDDEDDYPFDPLRAFDNYFPAEGYGSLAFEDLYPGKGDYDFNDLVVDYRFQTVTNAGNDVVEIFGDFPVKASGASFDNGFGFSLPDANPLATTGMIITGQNITRNYITLLPGGLEAAQSLPTVIVFDNLFDILVPYTSNG
nr:LruC domain-containing protein [Bacteroidota bacterium]